MMGGRIFLEESRSLFAAVLSRVSGRHIPDIERAFRAVHREDFLPPGPWLAFTESGYVPTPSADPVWLQQNLLFAIDREKGINNGQPSLHGKWLAAVDPKPGERVLHVGCGNGFYSAVLASLVGETGAVTAFEIEPEIAAAARRHLGAYSNVDVRSASAANGALPASDVIYVNAASAQPLASWIDALRPGGRLMFPWQADPDLGVSMLITKDRDGLSAKVLGPSRFIPLRTETVVSSAAHRGRDAVWKIASLVKTNARQPDETSVAFFDQYWFSTSGLVIAREGERG
jgi:protein-L-isoaspartate(D-aspartate) O-methyltransferase